jgi:O-antigen/teichoic acid export membrane protein
VLAASFLHLFIDQPATISILIAFAAAEAFSSLGGPFEFLQRFARRPMAMASVQVIASVVRASIICVAVLHDGSLQTYAYAVLTASALSASINAMFLLALALRYTSWASIFQTDLSYIPRFAKEVRFLVIANLSGYGKLFHRTFDVLLVGYVCSDRETGLYKFARSLTDALYIVYDATNKAFQADMFAWLARAAADAYRTFALRLALIASGATALVLGGAYYLLPSLLEVIVGDAYLQAINAILWLCIPVFFIFGIQLWMWPILVVNNRLAVYAGLHVASVAIFQYLLSLTVVSTAGVATASVFALGYACVYPATYIPLYLLERRLALRYFPA